jgi:general secretion pathway protein G
MRSTLRKTQRQAFTLIELLLVMVILVVLAAVVVPKFTNRTEQARTTRAKQDITTLDGAMEQFQVDCGRYPTNDEGLKALVEQPAGVQNWHGPYIKRGVPADPWNNAYVYQYPGTHNPTGFDLYSMGPDGRAGNDDIDNWSQQ